MIGYEEKAKIATLLNIAADAVGRAVGLVEEMARRDIETVRDESDAADKVVIEGPELVRALHLLARRYER